MMTNTLNSEKKAIMELDPDVLATVSGGAYTVDESIPEVQAFIEACKAKREHYLSLGQKLEGPTPLHLLNAIFIELGCYRVLTWWEMLDIMDKYFMKQPANPGRKNCVILE